jgi:hypothetical protein
MTHTNNDNKIWQIAIIGIIILGASVLTGCTQVGQAGTIYYTGYDGLSIELFNSNPKQVFEDDYFATYLFVKNNGPYTVGQSAPGSLQITYDNYYLEMFDKSDKQILVNGKNALYPAGDEDYAEFPFHAKTLSNLRDSVTTTITYSLCYPYRTELSIGTCIDTKIYSNDVVSESCKATPYTNSDGQGGPIVITKVEPQITSTDSQHVKPQYNIYIQNKGGGYVINNPDLASNICSVFSREAISQNLNKIKIKASLSGKELDCEPKEVRIIDGSESFARCTIKDENAQDFPKSTKNYNTILTVVLDYGYVEVQTQDLEIKRQYEIDRKVNTCGYYYRQDASGKCVPLCDYCADPKNAHSEDCQKNKPVSNFAFDSTFSCACSKQDCITRSKTGECIFGYCPGETTCCKANDCYGRPDNAACGDHQVCKDGKCSDKTQCDLIMGSSGFTCMDSSKCRTETIQSEPLCSQGRACCKAADSTTITT